MVRNDQRIWQALVSLPHQLIRKQRCMAILSEGRASCACRGAILVKASRRKLASLVAADVTECRFAGLLALMNQGDAMDAGIDHALCEAFLG
jgi:hypothetical protein